MSRITSIEYDAGYGACYVATRQEVDAIAVIEKRLAVDTCARLSRELAQADPVKAAALDAASKDERLSAYEMFGLCKEDGRTPKPAGEIATKPASGGVK
jgi:hypothetical protein